MADKEKISIQIEADDNASSKLNNVKSNLSNLSSSIGSLNSALRQYNSAMSTFNNMMINGVKDMGSAIYDFTTDSIDNFSELSEQHAKTLGAMANDYENTIKSQQKFMEHSEKLKQQAIDLAKYGVNGQGSLATSVEVSATQTELVKAGISAETMLNTNVVSEILQFAQANQLGTAEAVEFAVSLGNQFDVGYEDWGDMLDKVSHTADMSIIDVKDIVASMKYAGGISSGIDRPMEEVLGMISVLGNFGLRGSQAGSGIQAFLTRLLTGDTTVITDAMAEVAPEKALKAFYDFSNYAKSDGSEITYDDILNETFTATDITGQLRPMEEIADVLESTMGELNDEEQAWFAKKLFGLYQMKSAYALINGDDSGDMALSDVIKEIEENSSGTNANKLAELVNSQSGQIEVTKNLFETIKTEFGQMLEPTTLAVLHELQEFMKDPGHYEINWDNIQSALDESCDAIEEAYGTAIADAVRNLGGLTIDLGQVMEEISPELLNGLLDVFNSLISGNIFGEGGVAENWDSMIENMGESLEKLPPDLKELGEKVIDVIDAFGKLAALNTATTIAQLITSVLQIAMMTINAASVVVNGSTITGGGAGGTGTGGTGNTVVGNLAGIGGAIVGGIAGDKVGDVTGQLAGDVSEKLGASEEAADTINTGVDLATTVAGTVAGTKVAGWVAKGGIQTLINSAKASSLYAMETGTAIGGGSLIAGTLPVIGIGAGIAMLGKTYYDNHQMESNRQQTGDIVRNGGKVEFDRDGNLIKDSDGNAIDFSQFGGIEVDPYKYNNGQGAIMSNDQDAYNREQEQEQLFYTVQKNYEAVTGGKLTWDDYRKNKDDYNAIYSDSTNELIGSINSLNDTISSMVMESVGVKDWSKIIPGYNIMSEKGRQNAVQNYLDTQLNVAPIFNMEAPQIQVDVTVDSNGNITSQKQAILNPRFNSTINNWYQKVASQNGSTTK